MLLFLLGILFIKILFGNIFLLPLWYIIHQYLSPIPLSIYNIPFVIAIIYKQYISIYYISSSLYLLFLIPYGLYFTYFHLPNPISENKILRQYIYILICEIFKSSILLFYHTLKNPILKTKNIHFQSKLNSDKTILLAGSITATPGTYTITTKKDIILLNTINEFDESLYKQTIFQNEIQGV